MSQGQMLVHPLTNPSIKSIVNILVCMFWCVSFWRDSQQTFFCFHGPFKQVLLWQLLRHCLPFSTTHPILPLAVNLPPSLAVCMRVRGSPASLWLCSPCSCVFLCLCVCVCRWMWGWYTSLLWWSHTSSSPLSWWRKWSGTSFSSAGSTATKDSSKRSVPSLLRFLHFYLLTVARASWVTPSWSPFKLAQQIDLV